MGDYVVVLVSLFLIHIKRALVTFALVNVVLVV
jgi:hypothetical protein